MHNKLFALIACKKFVCSTFEQCNKANSSASINNCFSKASKLSIVN